MSLPSRLLGANPSIQVSTLLSGSLTTPSAKGTFQLIGFESISSSTLSTSSASVTFSSISSDYEYLQLRCFYSNLSGDADLLRFNGDTGSNYDSHRLTAQGNSPNSQVLASNSAFFFDRYSSDGVNHPNVKNYAVIDIHDYSSTDKYKSVRSRYGHVNSSGGYTGINGGLWKNTNSITSITVLTNGGNFTAGSTFALYGIY